MTDIAYVKVFLDWTEATRKLKDAEKGRLIDAMVAYAKGEENEDQLQGNEAYVFPMFKLQIDRDRQEYEALVRRQRENGSKGGRPKKANGLEENPKNPLVFSKTQKSQDKEEDKEKEEEKDKDKDKEEYIPPKSPKGGTRFAKPTLEEVQDYCRERENKVDAQKFYDYYTSNGWRVGKNPMKDWKATVRTWERTSRDYDKGTGFASSNPFLEMLNEERGR